jgi:hypothetical protein
MSFSPRIILSQRWHSGRNANAELLTRLFRQRLVQTTIRRWPEPTVEPAGSDKDTHGVLGRADHCRSFVGTFVALLPQVRRGRDHPGGTSGLSSWNVDRFPERSKLMILAVVARVCKALVAGVESEWRKNRGLWVERKTSRPDSILPGHHLSHDDPNDTIWPARSGVGPRISHGPITAVEDGASGGVVRGNPLAPWR